MNIPFFSLQRQWNSLKNKLEPAIKKTLNSQYYIGGPEVQKFEEEFANFVESNHAISNNSGTDSLWLALKALKLKPSSLVITTPFSFIASSSEIIANKGIPVFIDIDQTSYNISTEKIKCWLEKEAVIQNNKTFHKATNFPIVGIIAVNIFGQCADFTSLRSIADEWKLWIIEDAAQSIGATHNKQQSGSLGDISCFSFYPTKNLGAFGDAGALTTKNAQLAERLLQLRNHGRTNHYNYEQLGINSRLDAIQATVLREKLKGLTILNKRRNAIAKLYINELAHIPFIKLPHKSKEYDTHVYHQFSIQVVNENKISFRKDLIEYLNKHEIGSRIFYPKGLNKIEFLVPDKRFKIPCPISDSTTSSILSLPIWPELIDEEVLYICKIIKNMPLAISKNKSTKTTHNEL